MTDQIMKLLDYLVPKELEYIFFPATQISNPSRSEEVEIS